MRAGLTIEALIAMGVCVLGIARLSGATADAPASAPKRVLIVESFGGDIAPWNAIAPAFKTRLTQQLQAPVEFHEPSIETARENQPQAELAFAAYLRQLYAARQPDLVVPIGWPAAQFWNRHREGLFPSAPVVVAGLESRMLSLLTPSSNRTVVTFEFDLRAGPESVFELFPATTNVAVIVGDSVLERFWIAEVERVWTAFTNRAALVWFNQMSFPEMCQRAATLPPRSALIYASLAVDATGVRHGQMEALDQIRAVANAPLFGPMEEYLGHGILGGRLISSRSFGRQAADIAARLLRGEAAGAVASAAITPGPPTYDWRELQRWNLDERRLPAGSTILFRQPPVWERYRGYILGTVAIMAAQAATIAGLVVQRARRRRAEASAYELAGRLISVQEKERQRLAGELHDGLSQDLLVIANQAQLSLTQTAETPGIAARLTEIAQSAHSALQQARRLVHNLRPGLLEELGLTEAIQASAEKIAQAGRLSAKLEIADIDGLLPAESELNLFRIVQEALNNILKHAGASEFRIVLTQEPTALRLLVEDNGRGFDLRRFTAPSPDQPGLGMRQMSERIRMIGGRMDLDSHPGRGTRLIVTVPQPRDPITRSLV
ncbi:MAG TPA: histidine kinase [Verrucomicrobiota bacterium]|nr:histidine kinase [Verrucomicrobiota bacterium]